MADESDVTALFAQLVAAAVYPNGTGAPSVTGTRVSVFEEWPDEKCLDADIRAGQSEVSIFPQMGGSTSATAQYLRDFVTVVAPVHGLSAVVDDNAVTVSGAPSAGEFLSLVVNGDHVYSEPGDDVASILAAIAADAAADFLGVAVAGQTITFPGAYSLEARSGAAGVIGTVTHRQKMLVNVTVWAPSPAMRSALAAAITVALDENVRVTFPDGSQGIVRYSTSRTSDERITAGIYRRDLIYEVEYATLSTRAAVEITVFGASLDLGPSLIGNVADASLSSEGTYP